MPDPTTKEDKKQRTREVAWRRAKIKRLQARLAELGHGASSSRDNDDEKDPETDMLP